MIEGSVIKAPINIADPYTVMGVGKLNGTWYDVAHICTNGHGKINKWAKYKPFILDTPSEAQEFQKELMMYGMDVYYSTNLDDVIEKAKEGDWGYLPPKINVNYSRITDFIGYNHNCVKPCEKALIELSGEEGQEDMLHTFYLSQVNYGGQDNNLLLQDIFIENTSFRDCYFTIVTINENGEKIHGRSSEKKFGDESLIGTIYENEIYLPLTRGDYPKGTYYMIPIISNYKRDFTRFIAGQTWKDGWYAVLPTLPGKLTIRSWEDIDLTVKGVWNYESNGDRLSISFDVFGTNKTDSNANLGKAKIIIGYLDMRDDPYGTEVYEFEYELNGGRDVIINPNVENVDMRLGGIVTADMTNSGRFYDNRYFIKVIVDRYVNEYRVFVEN